MKQDLKKNLPSALLLILLAVLILCPLIMVFAKAIVNDGRLDLYQAWENIANPDNLETIRNSMLLGVCVEQSIAMFRGDLTEYFKTAPGVCALSGAVFDVGRDGRCASVERVWETCG